MESSTADHSHPGYSKNGQPGLHLSIGQPDLPAPKNVVDAAVEALQAGQTGYTMDAGLPELLDSLATYYGDRYQRELTADNILVTTGATEAIYLALTAVAAPGRHFIVPDPAFMLYAPLIRMNGGEVRRVRKTIISLTRKR